MRAQSKRWAVSTAAAVMLGVGTGCGGVEGGALPAESGVQLAASTHEITDVDHTPVKRQSIGNCWLYATATWAESLHLTHTGNSTNMSESYWTYWHWFEQIANGRAREEISTGGSWGVAVDLIRRYGVMFEGDFIPAEAEVEMSAVQKQALAEINRSLKEGVLANPTARRDRAVVKAELDRAWGLSTDVVGQMESIFGRDVSVTLDRSEVALEGSLIRRANDILIGEDSSSGSPEPVTLLDAIGTRRGSGNPDDRNGRYAWREVSYPSYPGVSRRTAQQRIQRALHARKPVVITWFVDFNALNSEGAFAAPPETIGSQGGHMTVLEDYEADNVPGYGLLPAGVTETRPEVLEAALDPATTLKFLRTKNSWGSFREDRAFALPGYHDLYFAYLDGPLERCTERAAEPADLPEDKRPCVDSVPTQGLNSFVLPPGF